MADRRPAGLRKILVEEDSEEKLVAQFWDRTLPHLWQIDTPGKRVTFSGLIVSAPRARFKGSLQR